MLFNFILYRDYIELLDSSFLANKILCELFCLSVPFLLLWLHLWGRSIGDRRGNLLQICCGFIASGCWTVEPCSGRSSWKEQRSCLSIESFGGWSWQGTFGAGNRRRIAEDSRCTLSSQACLSQGFWFIAPRLATVCSKRHSNFMFCLF